MIQQFRDIYDQPPTLLKCFPKTTKIPIEKRIPKPTRNMLAWLRIIKQLVTVTEKERQREQEKCGTI